MKRFNQVFFVSFCLLVTVLIFNGCTDKVGNPYEPEAKILPQVEGLVLFCNGDVIATVDKVGVTGIVSVNMEASAEIFEVEFFDEKGEVVELDPQIHRMTWNNDPAYATFQQEKEWTFFIYGQKAGETTFELKLENGSNDRYQSPPILLKIQ